MERHDANELIAGCKNTVIPDSVKKIADYAFYGMDVEKINIPSGVTRIGDMAFEECTALKEINISDTVSKIGIRTFAGCDALEKITVDAANEYYYSDGSNAIITKQEIPFDSLYDFANYGEAIIDQIGGVEIDVKEYQLHELNKYIGQATGGGDCPVEKAGLQILNGKQALSYARIRKGVGDDYERTERQREVLFKVAEKLQKTDVIKYFSIANKMLDYLRTNIESMDGLNMAYTISKFSNLETEQLSIPVHELCVDEEFNGNMALRMDRYENALILNDFIFNDTLPDFILNRSTEKNQSIYYEYEGFGE